MSPVITVEIAGQRYPIRSSLDERYVAELAAFVERKMESAAESAPASDTLGLAILVALNIADEYFRARDHESAVHGEINERTMRLEQLVDDVLAQVSDNKPVSVLDRPPIAG
jgi:cell division protein ZapA